MDREPNIFGIALLGVLMGMLLMACLVLLVEFFGTPDHSVSLYGMVSNFAANI